MFFKGKINSDSISLWIKTNFNGLLFVFGLSAFLALAFIAWGQWSQTQKQKNLDKLYQLKKDLQALIKTPPKLNPTEEWLKDLQDKPKPLYNQEMKDKALVYETAIRKSQPFIAIRFAIDLADFYHKRDDKQKAIQLLKLFVVPTKKTVRKIIPNWLTVFKSEDLFDLATFQLASYYINDNKCEQAIELFSTLSENPKASYLYLQSLLQKAFCLEELKLWDKALVTYEKIINKSPESLTGRQARDYKQLLILKRNLKKDK